jgi:integrase
MRLTAKSTAGLTLPAGKIDHIEFDSEVPGFGVRIREGGSRTYVFQYKTGNRQRRIALGAVSAIDIGKARETAKDLYARVRLGQDPKGEMAEHQARAGETFEACMRLYLERRRNDADLRPSSYREIERHLTRNLKALHGLRIDHVDRRAIALELGRITTEAPIQANRTRANLVTFLSWCVGEGFIDANPAMFTNKNKEVPRDRVLADAELRKIWRALPDGDYGDIVHLLMLSGQRASEIGDLRWAEIDLDRSMITLPSPRTKNGRRHTIPLSDPAAAILKARSRYEGRNLVFGTGQGGFSGWGHCKARLDADGDIESWRIHDIRRAVATGMGELGVQPHVVEAVLNHVSGTKGGIAGRYNKASYEAEKTDALTRWAEHLLAVIEGRKSKVTPIRRPA